VVSSTPRPQFDPGKEPVPILQEPGLAPGSVWTVGKSRPHWDSITDRPVRSQSLHRLSYRAHKVRLNYVYIRRHLSVRDKLKEIFLGGVCMFEGLDRGVVFC